MKNTPNDANFNICVPSVCFFSFLRGTQIRSIYFRMMSVFSRLTSDRQQDLISLLARKDDAVGCAWECFFKIYFLNKFIIFKLF